MPKKITSLTPEQIARMPEWVEKWLAIGLSTAPADFDAADLSVRNCYAVAKLTPPKVILRMSSPFGAVFGGALAEALLASSDSVRSQVGSQVRSQVWSQVESQVRSQVGSQVRSQVRSQVWSQVRSQVESQVGSQVESQVRSQVESQVRSQVGSQVESQVWSQVRSQVGSQVGSQVRSQVGSILGDRWGHYRGGNLWASWYAYVSFFRDVCGWEDDSLAAYGHDEMLAQSASWVWLAPDVAAISDRPEIMHRDAQGRLHSTTEAALKYRDGWAIHAVHGVRVPGDIIDEPASLTVARIEAEENAEIRRVMIDLYGAKRYLTDSGAIVVNECKADHYIVGLRTARLLRKDVPGDESIVMIDLLNSTPEPDGTVKRYLLRVDPSAYAGEASRDCLAAAASTWRMPDGALAFKRPQDYQPIFES